MLSKSIKNLLKKFRKQHVGKRGEVHAGFWWGNLGERDHMEDPGVDGYSGSGMKGRGLD
jgi:hypothetical protein